MADALIPFPPGLIPVRDFSPLLEPVQRVGRRAWSGRTQVIDTGESIWRLSLTTPTLHGEAARRYSALLGRLRGPANIAELHLRLPLNYNREVAPLQVPHAGGAWLSDGTGYTDSTQPQPLVVTTGCAAGGEAITVGLTAPVRPAPRPGDFFSDGGFLYQVTGVTGGVLAFQPRARAAILAGAVLGTEWLVTRWRLDSAEEGRPTYRLGRFVDGVTVNLTEAFER